jgi:hypothetical protein
MSHASNVLLVNFILFIAFGLFAIVSPRSLISISHDKASQLPNEILAVLRGNILMFLCFLPSLSFIENSHPH